MGFQVRRFVKSEEKNLLENEFVDLYIHKKGHRQVGIKIRRPIPIKNGWKIQKVQCKVLTESVEGVERWVKFKSKFQFKFKVKKASNNLLQYIGDFNKQLSTNLLSHKEIKQQKKVHEWVKDDITDLFIVAKSKSKSSGSEKAVIQIEKLFGNKFFYFQSECHEGDKHELLSKILQKWNIPNTSYPSLLDSL